MWLQEHQTCQQPSDDGGRRFQSLSFGILKPAFAAECGRRIRYPTSQCGSWRRHPRNHPPALWFEPGAGQVPPKTSTLAALLHWTGRRWSWVAPAHP